MKIIIDWNSIFYKLYFWMKDVEATNSVWVQTWAIYWFLRYLTSLKKQYGVKTEDFYIAFDNTTSKEPRKELFPEYKDNRLKTDSDLFAQLSYLLKLLDFEWIKYITLNRLEADDICFQLALNFNQTHTKFLVISRDHDLLLNLYISENSQVFVDKGTEKKWPNKWQSKSKLFTREYFKEYFGFWYHHFLDYKILVWDSSDNIAGIEWVGETWALNLFIELDTISSTLSHILSLNKDSLTECKWKLSKKSQRVIEKVIEQRDSYDLYKKIMSPITGFTIPMIEDKSNYDEANKIYDFLDIKTYRYTRD